MEAIDTRPVLVSIRCTVYNHEPYLRQCLDGFVMQKTNFRFEAIVHDDASTDGSAAIIREYAEKYPDIIKPIYQTVNQYSQGKGGVGKAMNAAMSPECKYIAVCEGDDYWIDPNKLQTQVDFLESHQEYSMCFHKVATLCYIPDKASWHQFSITDRDYSADELFEKWIVPTCSILIRKEVYFQPIENKEKMLNGDIFIVMKAAKCGKVHAFSKIMAVYRVQTGGVTYDNAILNKRLKKYPDHFECIKENFPSISEKLVNKELAFALLRRANIKENEHRFKDFIRAVSLRPTILFEYVKIRVLILCSLEKTIR